MTNISVMYWSNTSSASPSAENKALKSLKVLLNWENTFPTLLIRIAMVCGGDQWWNTRPAWRSPVTACQPSVNKHTAANDARRRGEGVGFAKGDVRPHPVAARQIAGDCASGACRAVLVALPPIALQQSEWPVISSFANTKRAGYFQQHGFE